MDQEIERGAWYEEQRGRESTKTERYGKKLSVGSNAIGSGRSEESSNASAIFPIL